MTHPILPRQQRRSYTNPKRERGIRYEPLLPAEKKLIAISLLLGVVLLGVLLWISATYFPVAPASTGIG